MRWNNFFDHFWGCTDEHSSCCSVNESAEAHLPEIEEHGDAGANKCYDVKLYDSTSPSFFNKVTCEDASERNTYDGTCSQYS